MGSSIAIMLIIAMLIILVPLVISIFTQVYEPPIVAVYFYVWYSEGLGNRHWNDSIYNVVVDEPLIGYYSSIDEEVIRWQLNLIKQAGINVLFISWWGPNSYEDRAAKKVFSLLKDYGLKATIFIEPYLGNDPNVYNYTWWNSVLNYIYHNYVVPYRESYFVWDGKPLVLAFNPIGKKYIYNDFRFTIRIVGNSEYVDWDYWIYPPRIRDDGYIAIIPRYDDYFLYLAGARQSYTRIDYDYSERIYEEMWKYVLENRDKIKLIAICSWNEYHERTMIEPHYDTTANIKYDPYNMTRHFITNLKSWMFEILENIIG